MKVIPNWVWGAIIAALVALLAIQDGRIGALKVQVEKQRTLVAQRDMALSQVNEEAAMAKASWETERGRIQATHARQQQESVDDFQAKLRAADTRNRNLVADNQRLRNQVDSYTTITRTEGEPYAAFAERAADRLQLVGRLLAEGIDLEAESRRIIEQRDAEVKLLMDQIRADRQACSPEPRTPS